jgi:hypothetical protein
MDTATLARKRHVAPPKCPVETALREWARLKRQGQPKGEVADPESGDTPWEAALFAAENRAQANEPTSRLGAIFQLLIGSMYGDMDGVPAQHLTLLNAYGLLRNDVQDVDLALAERHYFGGRALYNLYDLPARQANLQHWARPYKTMAWAKKARAA